MTETDLVNTQSYKHSYLSSIRKAEVIRSEKQVDTSNTTMPNSADPLPKYSRHDDGIPLQNLTTPPPSYTRGNTHGNTHGDTHGNR